MGSSRGPCVALCAAVLLTCLPACRGTTELQRAHSLWSDGASAALVYLLRPEDPNRDRGVVGSAIELEVDGEWLADLARGDYTVARLQPGHYELTVKNQDVRGPRNHAVTVTATYDCTLRPFDRIYLRFRPPPPSLASALPTTLATIPLYESGGNPRVTIALDIDMPDGIIPTGAFELRGLTEEQAVELAAGLMPIDAALDWPLAPIPAEALQPE